MKILILFTLLSLKSFSFSVYGEDNRKEWYEMKDEFIKHLARSTAVMVNHRYIRHTGKNNYSLSLHQLKNEKRLCENEKFFNQISIGSCSGFLVSDKILITAGHCVPNESACRRNRWIFDYKINSKEDNPQIGSRNNVFRCRRVIKSVSKNNFFKKIDYAVIELDRSTKREHFRVDLKNPVLGTPLMAIGYPNGLPLKVTDSASIVSIRKNVFTSDLDTFAGSSGSPVLNADTLQVIGILVSGKTDYKYSKKKKCYEIAKHTTRDKKGEDSTILNRVKF